MRRWRRTKWLPEPNMVHRIEPGRPAGGIVAVAPCAMDRGIECAYSWWLAALVLVISSISFGAVSAVPVLLKPLAREWNTGAASIAWVHMSTLVGAGLGSLVLGRMMDRWGFFPIALTASVATACGLFLASRASGILILHLACGVLIGGVGQGAFFSPLTAALSRWFDRHRALAMAIGTSGQSVGGFFIPPLLRLGADRIGWRTTLELYAGVALALLVPCALAFRRALPVTGAATSAPAAEQRNGEHWHRFWTLGLALALTSLATFVVIGHVVAFGEERGFTPVVAASLMSGLLGATLFSRLLAGWLARHWGGFRVLLVASAIHLTGIGLLAVSQGYPALVAASALIGLGFGGYLPIYALLASDMFPASESGRRIAEMYFFAFVAAGLGSGGGGWVHDVSGGYAMTFRCAALMACAGMLILVAKRKRFDVP